MVLQMFWPHDKYVSSNLEFHFEKFSPGLPSPKQLRYLEREAYFVCLRNLS